MHALEFWVTGLGASAVCTSFGFFIVQWPGRPDLETNLRKGCTNQTFYRIFSQHYKRLEFFL